MFVTDPATPCGVHEPLTVLIPNPVLNRIQLKTILWWLALWVAACGLLAIPRPAWADSPLHFVVENQTFVYNQEHTNIDAINDGFTLIGNQTKTYFRYAIAPAVAVDVGAFLDFPFGEDDRVSGVDPIISLHWGFAPGWQFTAGTIDRNHPLHDAFFNDNLRYIEPIEQGFQIRGDTQHILQDTWLSWEERETQTKREKFAAGNYTQLKAGGFMVDAQVYWVHMGGQKNSGPGVWNNLSYGFGTGYTYHHSKILHPGSFLDNIGFTIHYLVNQDDPPALPQVDEEGVALRVFATVWDTYVYGLFWEGGSAHFNSPRGDSTQPGVPLAKGDPFYKAEDFQEVGVIKTWTLGNNIYLTGDVRGQYILDRFVHIAHLNVTWRDSFALFEEFFSKKRPDPTRPPQVYWPQPR
ncbi:hypothetical protein ACTRW9_05000 [Nitrospina sp. 32_T5]|uniref:hypothetical protein n=1 Tax=unclassified Nitrospina TaxID=2638683 RepID=UPI003F97150F